MRSQQLLEALAGEPLPQWSRFAAQVTTRQLDAGQVLFAAQQPWPSLAVVDRGVIKLSYTDPDGNERIKSLVAEGGFFASVSALVPGGVTTFAAIASTPACVEVLPYQALRELGEAHVAWQRALIGGLQHYGARKEQRERELLMLTPAQRYQKVLSDNPQLVARVTQKDLALYLGVTPVALSRIRRRLKEPAAEVPLR
jgi:CRP-like cAMP-binding protein